MMISKVQARRILVAKAGTAILDAMAAFTTEGASKDNDSPNALTALEWMEVLAVASERFRRDALKDEWDELKETP